MKARKKIEVGSGKEKGDGIKVNELLQICSRLKNALSDRGAIPRADHFVFMKGARIGAYSGSMAIVANLPPGFPDNIEGSTEGKVLYGLLSSLPEKMEVKVSEEKGTLVIESERSKFGVAISDRNKDDEMDDMVFSSLYRCSKMMDSGEVNKKFSDEFRQAIVLCSFYASRDLTRHEECGVLARSDGEVVATDSHRGFAIAYSGFDKVSDFCIRGTNAVVLDEFPDKTLTTYTTSDKQGRWTYFQGSQYLIAMGEEPRMDEAEEMERSGEKGDGVELPVGLKGTLETVLLLLNDLFVLDREVVLVFKEKTVTCSAAQSNRGWFREVLPLKRAVKGTIEVRMNPVFLKGALRHATTMHVDKKGYVVTFVSGDFECTLRTIEEAK